MVYRENNFDLIRLIAAFQVMVMHGIFHLKIDGPGLGKLSGIFDFFPGVLMFFTISGFLIFSSLDRNKDLKKYFFNRVLRVYPGLWLCFIVTVILLLAFKTINVSDLFTGTMLKWSLGQLTFFQFWTPDLLRTWGVGTPNGSLWTIPVELQFYVILPAIVLLFRKTSLLLKFVLLAVVSVLFNIYLSGVLGVNESTAVKLSKVTVLPYLYSFLMGCIIYLNWNRLKKFIENKALIWLVVFFLFSEFVGGKPSYYPQKIQILSNILLSILTISMAFTLPGFSRVLKKNDISYGMYIYHMLVINSLVALGYVNDIKYLFLGILTTVLLSSLSWLFVERRALSMKYRQKGMGHEGKVIFKT